MKICIYSFIFIHYILLFFEQLQWFILENTGYVRLSYQFDPVCDVRAVVGTRKGVKKQLLNTVHIPGALVQQCDQYVRHPT